MVTIICPRCHAQLACPPGTAAVTCPHCANVSAVPATHAPYALSVSPPPDGALGLPIGAGVPVVPLTPKCSRAAYVVLAILLGGLGVHNFVAGRTSRGLIQLCLTVFTFWLVVPLLVVWTWVLVEVFTVKTDGNGLTMP